jgi:hypothetical protein
MVSVAPAGPVATHIIFIYYLNSAKAFLSVAGICIPKCRNLYEVARMLYMALTGWGKRVSEVFRKNKKKRGVIIPDDNIT